MRRPILMIVATIAVLALTVPAPARAHAQQALQLNQIMQGSAGDGAPAVFTFNAETPGVLTVVVRGTGDADLQMAIADAVGQTLPDGQVDQDLGGDAGAEQAAVVIRAAGDYQVRVSTWFGSGTFDIVAGWIAYPALGGPADPDGMPTAAASWTRTAKTSDASRRARRRCRCRATRRTGVSWSTSASARSPAARAACL